MSAADRPVLNLDGPDGWIRAFAMLYLEVEAGLRPMRHLRPLLAPDLQLRMGRVCRPGAPSDVSRIVVQRRGAACEAVVLLRSRDGRGGALVLALRRGRRGWQVTEVGRPELPPPPPAAEVTQPPLPQVTWHEEVTQPGPRPGWVLPDGWARPAEAA